MNLKKILIGVGFFVAFALIAIGGYGLYLSEDWKTVTKEKETTKKEEVKDEQPIDEEINKGEEGSNVSLVCTVDTSDSLSLTSKVRTFEFVNNKLMKIKYSVKMTGTGEDSSGLINKTLQSFEGIRETLLNVDGISIKVTPSNNAFLMELNQDFSIIDSDTVNSKLAEGQTLDINYTNEEELEIVKAKTRAAGYNCK